MFQRELEYWGIPDEDMEPCCYVNFHNYSETKHTLANLVQEEESTEKRAKDVLFTSSKLAKVRQQVWLFLDDPHSTVYAKVIYYVIFLFIFKVIF